MGADWAELDVQQTADGEVIVMHDSNLKRTTGLDKEVWQVTWDEIKDLDNGSWFDKKYQTVRIPTLEEVLKSAVEDPFEYRDQAPADMTRIWRSRWRNC